MKKYFSVQRARRVPAVPVLAAVGGGLRQHPSRPIKKHYSQNSILLIYLIYDVFAIPGDYSSNYVCLGGSEHYLRS